VILSTPFDAQSSTSLFLMRREEFVISGVSMPLPEQNNFKPPPEPVDSIFGVLNFVFLPNVSATTVAKGYTVDEPTMLHLALMVIFS